MSLGPAPAARPRHAPPQGPSTGRPRAPAPPRGPGIPRPGRSSTLVRTPRACGRPLPPLLPDYKRGIHYCGSHFGFMVSSPPILSVPLTRWSPLCQGHVLTALDFRWMFVPARIIPSLLRISRNTGIGLSNSMKSSITTSGWDGTESGDRFGKTWHLFI